MMMKLTKILILLILANTNCVIVMSQTLKDSTATKKIYTKYCSEVIIQFGDTKIDNNQHALNGVRTTWLTNSSLYTHIDITNSLGFIQGFGIRNIGIKTLDEQINSIEYDKITRRMFALGGSAAIKAGSFSNHLYLYAGGEYDLALHYRQKLHKSSHKQVIKQGEWLSSATERFIPSAFIGIQIPNGLNFQIKYYLKDFLNHSYVGPLGDFTKFSKTQLFYLSISMQFNANKENNLKQKIEEKTQSIDL